MRAGRAARPARLTMKIEVTRPFYLNGEPLDIGAQAEVDDRFARELIHNGKAVKVEEATIEESPVEEAPVEEAPVATKGKRK